MPFWQSTAGTPSWPVCLGSMIQEPAQPLGCALGSELPKIQSGAGFGQGSGCSCVHPRAAGAGGGLVPSCRLAGGGYGGFTFLTGQMFAFFPPKHLLACSILGSSGQYFKGKTEVTRGCLPYTIRGHRGISGCAWFKTNGGNVWRRCFLLQGCLNIPGNFSSCRTTCSTLCNPGGTNLSFSWWSGFRFRDELCHRRALVHFCVGFFFLSCCHETRKGLIATSTGAVFSRLNID